MSIFSKFGKWAKKSAGKIATVALPIAGFAAGLVAPSLGAAISGIAGKFGEKVKQVTGIADGMPGVFGIGDGLPGILGLGTGKAAIKRLSKLDNGLLETIKTKLAGGEVLTATEQNTLARAQAGEDMKSSGINPLFLVGGGLLALLALGGNSRR